MLQSLVNQTFLPKKVVVVNDNSSDKTEHLSKLFSKNYSWIRTLTITSSSKHLPGSKVIHAFYKGFELLDNDYDIICKFDADIILPANYLENIVNLFNSHSKIGIAGGLAYIEKNGKWIYETISSKQHVRGPFKAYKKACFKDIGGLKTSIGWDNIDTLLAQYYGWTIAVDESLKVKHLKPTGKTYHENSKYLRGEALYKMRMGFALTVLSALKSATAKRSPLILKHTILGYLKAKKHNINPLVDTHQGAFIRKLRWKGVRKSIGLSFL